MPDLDPEIQLRVRALELAIQVCQTYAPASLLYPPAIAEDVLKFFQTGTFPPQDGND